MKNYKHCLQKKISINDKDIFSVWKDLYLSMSKEYCISLIQSSRSIVSDHSFFHNKRSDRSVPAITHNVKQFLYPSTTRLGQALPA